MPSSPLSDHEINALGSVLHTFMGRTLTSMMRYAGFQLFRFGEVEAPSPKLRNRDVAISIGCPWVALLQGEAILSSRDFGPDRTRRDENQNEFYLRMVQ